jgi:integrase
MKLVDYPGVSFFVDAYGKTRYRFRQDGKTIALPGEPHSPEFDARYQAAIEGRAAPARNVVKFEPRSLRATFRLLLADPEWQKLDDKSKRRYQQTIERILAVPIGNATWGDGPIEELKRQHVKALLGRFAATPHMERIVLICLRKLIMAAIEAEWITTDPTYGMKKTPRTEGHKTWTGDMMAMYESRYPVGSRQRTAYALALWLGNRASDVVRLKWSDLTSKSIMINGELRTIDGFEFIQFKGRGRGKHVFLPITPMLAAELAPLSRETGNVLVSARTGRGYTAGSLSVRFGDWAKDAGIPAGYTMHGLRKALGVKLAEADATTRQLMEALGHNNIAYAELYSREASRLRLSVEAFDKLTTAETARRRASFKVVG